MGCTQSNTTIPQQQQPRKQSKGGGGLTEAAEKLMNSQIEQEQLKANMNEATKIHLMILGTGDSGKTSK
jgi:hypothetical protein